MTRQAVLAVALAGLTACGCRDGERSATTRPDRPGYTRDEGSAYVIAHEFCRAWEEGDWSAARERMSEGLVQRYGEQRLRDEIEGVAHQKHEGFELTSKGMRGSDRALFGVRFVVSSSGRFDERRDPIEGEMVLIYRHGAWRVDNLPLKLTAVRTN
ncbi:MAG: hypothetical protein ACOC8F_04460 [Planctomycetota bacterium]